MPARPSLRALQAFAVTAEMGSVAKAALFLSVSPSAISHLLKELEASLDMRLFARGSKSQLSEAGLVLQKKIGPAFQAIDRAVAELDHQSGTIRVSALSTFCALWLVPRLNRFQKAYPDSHVVLSATTRVVDLTAEPYDCAIRSGQGQWDDVESQLLFKETLTAVAAPRLLTDAGLKKLELADIFGLPRISALSRPDDWPAITRGHALPSTFADYALICDNRSLAAQAAVAGLGVAVADTSLVSLLLASGQLVAVNGLTAQLDDGFYFIARPQALRDKRLRQFRDWLLGECRATPAPSNMAGIEPPNV